MVRATGKIEPNIYYEVRRPIIVGHEYFWFTPGMKQTLACITRHRNALKSSSQEAPRLV